MIGRQPKNSYCVEKEKTQVMYGYTGKILRIDLGKGTSWSEDLDEPTLKKWVGGVGLGTKFLLEEVSSETKWSDPENRLVFTAGPLGGSGVIGAGSVNVACKGPLTNMAGVSQANGFFGAYLKFSGFDGVILQGAASHLVYIVIQDGKAEIKDARDLAGKRVEETEDLIRQKLGVKEHDVSVYGIGPAGENRVLFSAILGDRGHAAAHNGLGAVMGAKNCKAIVAYKGKISFEIADPVAFKAAHAEMYEDSKQFLGGLIHRLGTAGGFVPISQSGQLPIQNYTQTTFANPEKLGGEYMRETFKIKSKPCYKCKIAHVKQVTVTEGPYKGLVGEEPEFELLAAWGPQIGNHDLGAVVMLTKEIDALGMDNNESGWVVGWAMECFEKGVFSTEDTDGLDLSWGNVEAVKALLNKIAKREGKLGNLLADGVKTASKKTGGEAADWAVYTEKGNTPRTHDHRGRWSELFDTCFSNTGTIESSWMGYHTEMVDMEPLKDGFSHEEVSTINAKFNGIRQFDDCLGTCRLCSPNPKSTLKVFNAVTGWNWDIQDLQTVGRRIVNALRVFGFRNGLKSEDERPSKRYGSVPPDGPARGKDIMAKWDWMRGNYYQLMGWDPETGRPLPETLDKLGLSELIDTF